jgi:hypothetical protein
MKPSTVITPGTATTQTLAIATRLWGPGQRQRRIRLRTHCRIRRQGPDNGADQVVPPVPRYTGMSSTWRPTA